MNDRSSVVGFVLSWLELVHQRLITNACVRYSESDRQGERASDLRHVSEATLEIYDP